MKRKILSIFVCFALIIVCGSVLLVGCDSDGNNGGGNGSITKYSITLASNNQTYGKVYGAGTYDEDEEITIVAVANDGYEFDKWSDGDKNISRNISVKSNKSLTAEFIKSKVFYSLNEVQIYITKRNNFSAKTVGFISFDITTNNNQSDDTLYVCRQDGFAGAINIKKLPSLISTDSIDGQETTTVNANQNNPYKFYAPRTSANRFEDGKSTQLKYSFQRTCWKYVTTSSSTYIYSLMHEVANPSNRGTINLTVTQATLSQTIRICSDADHGYDVYAKLIFVES
ncbi:MAG: hypothetical protein J6T74_07500 [Clostridia bacterium]|nr:hypothetical protein [Clostridia bacterium]